MTETTLKKDFYTEKLKTNSVLYLGVFFSSDKVLIREILERKQNMSNDNNNFEEETHSSNKMKFSELENASETSLDEDSLCKRKRARYETIQGVSHANAIINHNHVQNKSSNSEIKKLLESTSSIIRGKESSNHANFNNKISIINTLIENENNNDNQYIKLGNGHTIENNIITIDLIDESESEIPKQIVESTYENMRTKPVVTNQECVENNELCTRNIMNMRTDMNKSEVISEYFDNSTQTEESYMENDMLDDINGDNQSVNETEKNDNYDDKSTNVEHAKDDSRLQILNIRSIVLEVESVLFKKVTNSQNTKLPEDSAFKRQTKTSTDTANATQTSYISRNNKSSDIHLQSVTLIYNYFVRYFHNVRVIEKEGLDDFLKTKAREHVVDRYCSLFYTCYLKIPHNTSLTDLRIDTQNVRHLTDEAKKLSGDHNFNEIMFIEIYNTFISFLMRFKREAGHRQDISHVNEETANNVFTSNRNNENDPQTNTKTKKDMTLLSTNANKTNNKKLRQKRGRRPNQTCTSTATSKQIEQLEVTPELEIYPIEYEYFVPRQSNPIMQSHLNNAVSQFPAVNPLPYNDARDVHPRRDSHFNDQLLHMSSLSSRNNRMSPLNEVIMAINYAVRHDPSVSSQTQINPGIFLERVPPPPYPRLQQPNYNNSSHSLVPQNYNTQPNELNARILPNRGQYDPLNELYRSKMERSQNFVTSDRSFLNTTQGFNNQMMPLTDHTNNTPINFAKNAVAPCFVCKRNTTMRCAGCCSIFVCSIACQMSILETRSHYCMEQFM